MSAATAGLGFFGPVFGPCWGRFFCRDSDGLSDGRPLLPNSYVEYDRRGAVAGGLAKALPKTKYDEDVFEMGHTQVWGSFCKVVDGEVVWGYACCGGNHHHSPQESIRAAFSQRFQRFQRFQR